MTKLHYRELVAASARIAQQVESGAPIRLALLDEWPTIRDTPFGLSFIKATRIARHAGLDKGEVMPAFYRLRDQLEEAHEALTERDKSHADLVERFKIHEG